MAKLSTRSSENKFGQADQYTAIDGTPFNVSKNSIGRVSSDDQEKAKKNAIAHSNKVLAENGLRLDGDSLYDIKSGKLYDSDYKTAVRTRQGEQETADKTEAARADFDSLYNKMISGIKDFGAEQTELAKIQSARQFGSLESQLRNVLTAQGRDPRQIQEILARGGAGQQRGLADLLSGINQNTQGQLLGAQQNQIGTNMNLEDIGVQRDSLQEQMTQFLMSQSQQRDQFNRQMSMQPTGFEQLLGAGGTLLGAGLGSIFGPVGAAAGGQIANSFFPQQ